MLLARAVTPLLVLLASLVAGQDGQVGGMSFEDPDAANNWRVRTNPQDPTKQYYYNVVTQETSNQKPIDAESLLHWHVKQGQNMPGQTFFWNDVTGESTYKTPDAFKAKFQERRDPFMPSNTQDDGLVEPVSPIVNEWNVEAEMEIEHEQGTVVAGASLLAHNRGKVALLQKSSRRDHGIVVKYRLKQKSNVISPPPGYIPPALNQPPAGIMPPPQRGEVQAHAPVNTRKGAKRAQLAPIVGVMYHGHMIEDDAGLEEVAQESSPNGPYDNMVPGPPMPTYAMPGPPMTQGGYR